MLLTRSMRRKLAVALFFAIVPVGLLTISSMLSVISYRRMVNDLELSTSKLPRRERLITSITKLLEPLSVTFPGESKTLETRQRAADVQYRVFASTFVDVQEQVDEFKSGYQQLPTNLTHSDQEIVAFTTMFQSVDERLNLIRQDMPALRDPNLRDQVTREITKYLAEMVSIINTVPDPANRLSERLRAAKDDYSFYLRVVTAFGLISMLAFSGLLIWAYRVILSPIQRLHDGVQKVAEGDYGYKLSAGTTCELSQLAQTFNKMTDKIEQDQRDKDRAIEERSKQLVLSERLLGVGFLASGVAHEINNPLSVIMNCAYGLNYDVEPLFEHATEEQIQDIRDSLEMIQSETERCTKITAKLQDFAHGKSGERNSYDVTAIVREVADMVGHLSRYRDRKVTVHQVEPMRAWVCGPEIKQVVLNLVANGLDACEAGGEVNISIEDLPEELSIHVRDNGSGMTQEQLNHIFEPFFTTKEVGKGTGLGLSISHRIVQDHGGTLEVHSEGLEQGTEFVLRLPKAAQGRKAA